MSDDDEMRVVETEWWTLSLPPEWQADQDEEVILVGDEDGVGVLEFSTLHKVDGQVDEGELEAFMAEQGVQPGEPVKPGVFRGFHRRFSEDGDAVREWWLAGGSLLLFITYSCDQEHAGLDDAVVDQILDTLEFS